MDFIHKQQHHRHTLQLCVNCSINILPLALSNHPPSTST